MLPILNKQPAVISGAVLAVIQVLVLFNVIQVDEIQLAAINTALVAVLTLFVQQTSTPTASPTLEAGTKVSVKGTSDTVVVQPTPPGPTGYEGDGPVSG